MNLLKQLEKIYFKKIESIEKLNLGLTNDNYKVVSDNQEYFVRVPNKEINHQFDRALEKQINDLIEPLEIDIDYLYFDDESGIKISYYKRNLQSYQQYSKKNKHLSVASRLLKLHQANIVTKVMFNPRKKVESFKNKTKNFLFNLASYDYLLDYYDNYSGNIILCHNDLVDGNILFQDDKMYIIDYEYACDNYPIFDLTSFITENNILDEKTKSEFYLAYYKTISKQLQNDINCFEQLHHYIWCNWAMMMYEIKKEKIYYEIAEDKYTQLINYLR